jgi:CHAD domain-containing protein
MKTSKPGSGYLKKLRKRIITLLKKSPEKFKDEDYHKLRVEIKKLKAVAGFIQFSHKKFSKKEALKSFKKVYKQAGKIRELQLEASFLKKNNPQFIERYLSDLDKRIEKEKKKFASVLRKKRRRKTKKSIKGIKLFFQDTDEADSLEFINNERKQITQLTRELPLKPANVHQLRKILKEDFYNRKRMDQPSPKIKAEDDFLELLGSWHDCVVLNNQIGTSILKAETNSAELAELLEINAVVSLQSENLLNEINATLEKGVF